jgi:hypothetical protein
LAQFTNIFFDSGNYINYQSKYCNGESQIADVWSASNDTCYKDWPGYDFMPYVVSTKQAGKHQCYSIATPESNCVVDEGPSCYVRYYSRRYVPDEDFVSCTDDPTVMGELTAPEWFQANINDLLTFAKNAQYNQLYLNQIIIDYRTNVTNLFDVPYGKYKKSLQEVYNYYITLIPTFEKLRDYFKYNEEVSDLLKTNTILNNVDCAFMTRNSQVFLLLKQLVAEEIFGVGLLNLPRVFLLFINICCLVVLLLKLRSHIEIQIIKRDQQTVLARRKKRKEDRQIERTEKKKEKLENLQKERKSARNMENNIILENVDKKSDIINQTELSKKIDETVDPNKSDLTSKTNRKLVHTYDLQDQQLGKVIEFLKQEDLDAEKRLRNQSLKNI